MNSLNVIQSARSNRRAFNLAGGVSRVLVALALSAFAVGSIPVAQAAQARRAFDFTRAIGVRADLSHANYANNWSTVKSALQDLKIKNIRTSGKSMGTNNAVVSRVEELHDDLGIKFVFVFGSAIQTQTAMEASVDAAVATGAALAFEGPNEWSKHYYNDQNDDWDQEVKDFQVMFRSYVRNNGWPTGPILCPTAWRRDRSAYDAMNAIGVDNHCSVGNLHYYHLNTLKPTQTRGIVPSTNYTFTAVNKTMDEAIADQQSLKAGTWVTETGEPIATGGEEGSGVSPTVAGKYIPRLITEFFRRDVQKVFIFELLDASPGNYGLLTSTGAQRPAFTALKNMMTVLDNPTGSSFTPGSLNFSLNGASGITSLLLQKANGTFYLLLWKDVLSTDTDQTQLVQLSWNFTSPSVKTYLPLNSASPVNTWTNRTQIQANVRDHVLIVEIAP